MCAAQTVTRAIGRHNRRPNRRAAIGFEANPAIGVERDHLRVNLLIGQQRVAQGRTVFRRSACRIRFGDPDKTTATTEVVSSHPGETMQWSQKCVQTPSVP